MLAYSLLQHSIILLERLSLSTSLEARPGGLFTMVRISALEGVNRMFDGGVWPDPECSKPLVFVRRFLLNVADAYCIYVSRKTHTPSRAGVEHHNNAHCLS